MASLYQEIRGALQDELDGLTGVPAVAKEGVPYTPTPGTPFLEPTLIPTSSRPVTCGSDHLVLHEGLFQIAVVYPSGEGTGAAEAMADLIKQLFRTGTNITEGSCIVSIRATSRRTAVPDGAWVRVPVTIEWFTYDTRHG